MDDADHLLSRREDAVYVAAVLALNLSKGEERLIHSEFPYPVFITGPESLPG